MLRPADGTFETPRCRVRFVRVEDAAAMYVIRSQMPWDPQTRDMDATIDMLAEIAARPWDELGWRQFAVLDTDDRMIGDIGVNFGSPTVGQAELGFAFAPEARGQGLASESIGALIERLFDRAGLHRIEATTDARNLPTQRLLTRLRFRQEAHYVQSWPLEDGSWSDELGYARLASE
ncbi:GNAT family N-acetyltransferase [Glacieibacterium frigidum]|uniref:GNAT family N-acetyltransferase n=1 Tax=Glacieibacterium frigidum TaxID=2593303 RepID=A0A552UFM7_9SPHN|nr:GNAT family N-acetyltransferase [Glacieibacterium frigidum]TRW17022.1 GNAT family N-acetyltransferase [Glacieibacterium frigidum]